MGVSIIEYCVMGWRERLEAEDVPDTTLRSSMSRCAAAQAASHILFRIALFALLAGLGAGSAKLYAESAKSWYKQGQAAEAREDYDAAFIDYQKAYSISPKDMSYKEAYYRVQIPATALHMKKGRKLFETGDEQGALMEFLRASEIDPGDEAALQEIAKIRALHKEQMPANVSGLPEGASEQTDLDSMAAPVQLKPVTNEPLTLHMVEDSKNVYQAVGKAAGINVLFDPDYTGKRIQVDLTNVSLMDALRIVGTLSTTFWRPVTSNTIFVAANTRSKRTELDEQAVQTFYLTNAWQQNDLTDVQTAIRNVLPNSHAYGVASQNAIVMRGTPDELLLAQKLVNDLDKARPEVVVDIAVLEVNKSWQRTLGISWPQSATVTLQSPNASSTTCPTGSTTCTPSSSSSTNPTLYNLAHLNSNDFAVTIGTATANALLSDSNTKTLQNPRIRSTDAQKATMKIGSRIPIATGSFQSGVGVAAAVTPLAETQFQYIDVGVNIDMTPTVHYNHDVTLKIAIEVSSESNNVTIEGVTEPIIAQKKSEQTIRLREGEAAILGGILNQQDIQSWTGIPGLSSIPILKYLFGSKDHQITDDEIVFLLIPHVVRSPELTASNLRPIDTGAGQQIELRRTSTEGNLSPIAPPVRPPVLPPVQPGIGSVPGQSAQAAAPEALAQMRASTQGGPPPSTPNAASPPATMTPPAGVRFSLVPSSGSSVAAGTTFQVPIVITGARDIASVPLQVQYDPAKLSLVNVGDGDILGRDGQAVALVHRDDGPGMITINASRPPGTVGVSGAGVVCVLTFQAKTAGETPISITRPGAMTSAQQPVPAEGAQTTIVVK
ncbi:MAG: cohesin domain-containing protein [Terracidiphilus sp.]|jgi:general secretion pathway protein D